MTHFNRQAINRDYYTRSYGEESYKDNSKADPDAVERRRRKEAYEEAKRMRDADPIDENWLILWSME